MLAYEIYLLCTHVMTKMLVTACNAIYSKLW